jgi:hypothetical protein
VLRYRNAHFNRDASPIVLNLCAALLDRGAGEPPWTYRSLPGSFCAGVRLLTVAPCDACVAPLAGLPVRHMCRTLDLDLRLEYRHGLPDDPDTADGTILDFQLHVHTPGPMQLMPLHAAE